MQSELLSHISALFSGKGLRRFEAVFTTIDSPNGAGKKGLFSEKFKERFARKSDSIDDIGDKEQRQDGKSRTKGINLAWIANMDLKLNFKGTNSSDSPPPVPARHFSTDIADDLPPPIPERKCSLDSGIDEEFQGRFVFRPLSTVPLPEPYSNCSKTYPSKMGVNQGFQRPAHHPPPPPPPADPFPSPTEEKTIQLPTRSSPHQLKHASKLGFTPPASLPVNGTPSQKDSLQQSVYTEVPDDDLDLPPPPARRLPPPPPSKSKTSAVSTFIPSPAPISTAGTKSPKLKGFSRLMLPAIHVADTDLTHNLDSLPSTPPFTPPPPPPPPPPPLQTTSGASQIIVKNIATNGLPTSNTLDAYSDKLPESLPIVKEIKSYKELPQLPDKPSKKSTTPSGPTFGAKKHPPKPPTSNGISRYTTKIPSYNQKQTLPQGPETVPPKPEFSSRTNHPNKSRPLPTIPSVLTGKTAAPSKANGGRGGGEVFDPREEDGDIYDVMDSTDM